MRGTVLLKQLPPAAGGVLQRLPRVLPGKDIPAAVASRINSAFEQEDERGADAAAGCRELTVADGRSRDAGTAWTRSVETTMAGPRFLAVSIADSYYCGAYPNDGLPSRYVFDLTTGRPVDWLKLFPRAASAKRSTAPDGAPIGLVIWSGLSRRAAEDADAQCRELFEGASGFAIGLDARSGELTAVPTEFPHAAQACATEVRLTTAEIWELGFAPVLMKALNTGRLGNVDGKVHGARPSP